MDTSTWRLAIYLTVLIITVIGSYVGFRVWVKGKITQNTKDIDSNKGNINELYKKTDDHASHKVQDTDCDRKMDKLEEQSNFRDSVIKEQVDRIEKTMNSNTRELKLSISGIHEKIEKQSDRFDKKFDMVIREIRKNGNEE